MSVQANIPLTAEGTFDTTIPVEIAHIVDVNSYQHAIESINQSINQFGICYKLMLPFMLIVCALGMGVAFCGVQFNQLVVIMIGLWIGAIGAMSWAIGIVYRRGRIQSEVYTVVQLENERLSTHQPPVSLHFMDWRMRVEVGVDLTRSHDEPQSNLHVELPLAAFVPFGLGRKGFDNCFPASFAHVSDRDTYVNAIDRLNQSIYTITESRPLIIISITSLVLAFASMIFGSVTSNQISYFVTFALIVISQIFVYISAIRRHKHEMNALKQAINIENEQFSSHRPPLVLELLKTKSNREYHPARSSWHWSLRVEIQINEVIERRSHQTINIDTSQTEPSSLITPLLHS